MAREGRWSCFEIEITSNTTFEALVARVRGFLDRTAATIVVSPETSMLYVRDCTDEARRELTRRVREANFVGLAPDAEVKAHASRIAEERTRLSRLCESLSVGSQVYVTSGTYANLTGTLVSISEDRRQTQVRFEFRSKTNTVELMATELIPPSEAPPRDLDETERRLGKTFGAYLKPTAPQIAAGAVVMPTEARAPQAPRDRYRLLAARYATLKQDISTKRRGTLESQRACVLAARQLGISRKLGDAIALIFLRPDVPEWIRDQVEAGVNAPIAVARVLRQSIMHHGRIVDEDDLAAEIRATRGSRGTRVP